MRIIQLTASAVAVAALAASCGQDADAPVAPEAGLERPAPQSSEGAPFWTVSDADSTMILFPTIHILPDGLEWRSEEMDAALADAGEVWFEVSQAELTDQALVQAITAEFGLSPDRPLSERLDEETYAEFSRAAEGLGIPPQQIDAFRPWLAAVTLSVVDLQRAGFNPAAGVETILAAGVEDERERSLETAREQFGFFGGLSEEVEIAFLKSTLAEMERAPEQLRDFAEAWAGGDISTLEGFVVDNIRRVSEDLYQVLLVQRNENWADILERELEGSGTDFVAVGAGHLVGEDGLPTLLEARGYTVTGPELD